MNFAVLGDPVAHSLSPTIHRAGLEACGIGGSYVVRRVDAAGMEVAVEDLRAGRLDGANVTMPHKLLAAELCDHLGHAAARAGAVNTLSRSGATIVGDNTDVPGVQATWRWARLPDEAPVLVLGAGGAAAAALLALANRRLLVAARRIERAAALVTRLGVEAGLVAWGTPVSGAVIVNATPIGMRGEVLPDGLVAESSGLFEMAYGSGPTPATQTARAAGLPVAEGPDMLLAQAAVSFQIWTGRPAPVDDMRRALLAELAGRQERGSAEDQAGGPDPVE